MPPTVFVSYSGRSGNDKELAKHLLARLAEQPLEPWIYERIGSEVPPRTEIRAYCRTRIRKASLFIALISDSSFESADASDEVDYALQCHGGGEIFQIVATERSPLAWPGPYARLAAFKHIRVRPGVVRDLERAVEAVCAVVRAAYEPPSDGAVKLPLVKRLSSELDSATPHAREYENGIYSELRATALEVSRLYREGRHDHALKAVEALLYGLQTKFPGHPFYYPIVVKGVLEGTMGRDRFDRLVAAQQTFEQLIEDHRPRGSLDENALAGLAGVWLMRGNGKKAYDLFNEAHDLATAQGRLDPDLIHNILVAGLASGDLFAAAKAEAVLDAAPAVAATQDPFLKDRLTLIRAISALSLGETGSAERALSAVGLEHPHVTDLAVRLAQELCEQGLLLRSVPLVRMAERLLMLLMDDERSGVKRAARLALASVHCSRGYPARALGLLLPLLQAHPTDPQLLVEVALCYRAQGDVRSARMMCFDATSLALGALGNSMSERELRQSLYFRGFAYWLLGQEDLARRDARDAQFDAPPYAALSHRPL